MKKWDKILGGVALVSGAAVVASSIKLNGYVKKSLAKAGSSTYKPRVALMVPCKGVDPDFKENMQMLLAQDYDDFEVIFMTISPEDPCHPILESCIAESDTPARIVYGGFSRKRCQKLDNMLAGIDALIESELEDPSKPRAEVYLWADSDARVPANWMAEMVAPLGDDSIGVTSTYRFYRPQKNKPLSHMLALWTVFQVCHMHVQHFKSVWGGSMGVRRELFDEMHMRQVWDTALSDDCVLHKTVQAYGKKIEFVAPAMTTASSDLPTGETLEFAVRQCIIGKVVLKDIWVGSILLLSLFHLITGRGLWLTRKHLKQGKPLRKAPLAMLAFIPAGLVQAFSVLNALKQIETYRKKRGIQGGALRIKRSWALKSPAGYLFLWWSLLGSVFSNKFNWRDIHYHMKNQYETDVIFYPEELEHIEERMTPAHILEGFQAQLNQPHNQA